MSDNKKYRMPIAQIVFIVLTAISVGLLVFGALTPPPGEIHGSILQGVGLLFAFSALWVAAHTVIEIRRNDKVTAKVGNTSLTIEPDDNITNNNK